MNKYEFYVITKEQFETKEDCLFSTPSVEARTLQEAVAKLSELTHKVMKEEITYDPEYTIPYNLAIVHIAHRKLICFQFDIEVICEGPDGNTYGLIVIL